MKKHLSESKNAKPDPILTPFLSSIFLDPRMIAVFDTEHSENEDRWATIGIDNNGILMVVVHTFHQIDRNIAKIRIISARKATKKEAKQYREENR